MSVAYIDTSLATNGDGTTYTEASSEGGAGAYNNIQSYLDNASISGQTVGLIRRLNLGSEISISASLSPNNDGNNTQKLKLIGYPFKKTLSGVTISSIDPYSRTDGTKFNFSTTDTNIGDSSDYDHFWESAIITIHQSGSANDGLTRTCIWSEWDSTNNRMNLGLFPNLPEDLTTSTTFDIDLETAEYGNYSVSTWDNDTNARPIINGGDGSFIILDFNSGYYWSGINLAVKNSGSGYYCLKRFSDLINVTVNTLNGHGIYGTSSNNTMISQLYKHIYSNSYNYAIYPWATYSTVEHAHLTTISSYSFNQPGGFVFNSSCGKIKDSGSTLYINLQWQGQVRLFNCDFGNPSSVNNIQYNSSGNNLSAIMTDCVYKGTLKKFIRGQNSTEVMSINSTDTTYWQDPPSGVSDILKVTPTVDGIVTREFFQHPALVTKDKEKTITVKINPHGWSTALSNTDIWIELDYYDETTGIHTQKASSKGTGLTYSNDTWSGLSVTFTPKQSGIVQVKCYLNKYESGAYVLVDPGTGD